MWTNKIKLWRFTLCILLTVGTLASVVKGDDEVPSETQCRPYIEKALKEHHVGDSELGSLEENESNEVSGGDETNKESGEEEAVELADDDDNDTQENKVEDDDDDDETEPSVEVADEPYVGQESVEGLGTEEDNSKESDDNDSNEETGKSADDIASENDVDMDKDESKEADDTRNEDDSKEDHSLEEDTAEQVSDEMHGDSKEDDGDETVEFIDTADEESDEKTDETADQEESDQKDSGEQNNDESKDDADDKSEDDSGENDDANDNDGQTDTEEQSVEDDDKNASLDENDDSKGDQKSDEAQEDSDEKETVEGDDEDDDGKKEDSNDKDDAEDDESDEDDSEESAPEEELLLEKEIPENLRSREHIVQILKLNEDSSEADLTVERAADVILRDLKRLYENNIKPLENVYKYRDLSNRHFGDPEIFSKPLILFMGPWSGGKSSILNYLTGLEFTDWALRTGAEPSPAYFNILMHGKEPEVLDGTQMAADWTFSGLQKFGQGLEERLRGLKYPSKLLEKVNIVEIPGILEVRKQVSRVFPFNDACQWFIDRADIIFLVYDPSKLDVGPETEAILDQLKGRESQTRIVLNKADSVKPEELLRVQSALIWNISPLMSSPQPPVMYTVSLWSLPYEHGAPARLLQAQERDLLKDLRTAIDRRIENKIASARRFAVRVRNHAKMVDCYLTTYYNHKTIFGNKKLIADSIIENPQNYHIYEGLSTLTNISRYDLPDPETYRDFFRLNPLYEFQQLSATCTYFRGCPINKLDVAIAYDLPDLVGKYKKMVENVTPQGMPQS